MDDEDNAIETEVARLIPSSSESADGSDGTVTKQKKKKRNLTFKSAVPIVSSTTVVSKADVDEKEVDGVWFLEFPTKITDELGEADVDGCLCVDKEVILEKLKAISEPEPRVITLVNALHNLKWKQLTLQCKSEATEGWVTMVLTPGVGRPPRKLLLEAVAKKPRPWTSLGSEKEIQQSLVVNTRPMITIELETQAEQLLRPLMLSERPPSYVSLGPSNKPFLGIRRARMDTAVQAVPEVKSAAAQMDPGLPVNAWTQYVYDLEEEVAVQIAGRELPADYKFSEQDYMEQALEYNETLNLYTNDYKQLVKREEDTIVPPTATFIAKDALIDVQHVAGKVAVVVAWHPMRGGELAVLYASTSRSLLYDHSATPPAQDVFSRNIVLLWSLRDPLKPRLALECPREVLVIRWCPVDADVLVGCCVSGQVAIWDLAYAWSSDTSGEISQKRLRARKALLGVLQWKKAEDQQVHLAPAAMSALAFSHQGSAVDLQWLTPYEHLNSDGIYEPLVEKQWSMQFMTCGEDGAVLIWDLDYVTEAALKQFKQQELLSGKYPKTPGRFGVHHRTMRPVYKFLINDMKTNLMLTSLAVDDFKVKYEEDKEHNATIKLSDDDMDMKRYNPASIESDANKTSSERAVWLGTEDGQILLVHWQGFTFDKGEEVTTESVEADGSCAAVHDGPVVCILRAPLIPELLLSVGGHVFALWSAVRPSTPVLTRSSPARLTGAAWSLDRPSLFRIIRTDGTLDVWDLLYRSDRPILEQSVSGEPLTATANCPHATREGRRVLAVADYRSALQLFYMPHQIQKSASTDISNMRHLIAQETEIRNRYDVWNAKYRSVYDRILPKQKPISAVEEEKKSQQSTNLIAKLEAEEEKKFAKVRAKTPRNITAIDEEKMMANLLKKKNLDREELMAKQQPLRALQQLAAQKKEKIRQKMREQQKEFEKIVKKLLPMDLVGDVASDTEDETLRQEVKPLLEEALEQWQKGAGVARDKCSEGRTLERQRVLQEGVARRQAVDVPLYIQSARQGRYLARLTQWSKQPPTPPVTTGQDRNTRTSLALSQPPVAQKAGYPWQRDGGPHLPGGAVSVAHQFLRCTLHQLAPNGVFVQIFHTQTAEKTRICFFKAIAQALVDFPELTPSTPMTLLLETLNVKKSLTGDSVGIVCRNMATYLELVPVETGPAPPGSPWQTLLVQMDLFFRRIVLLLPTLEDILAPVALMPLLFKLPGIGNCKAILDPFGKVLSYAIQNTVVGSHVVIELCQLCGKAYTRDREKQALTRMLIIELVQALKFKTTMPDSNFIMLINFVIQDTGNCLVQTGLVTCAPDSVTSGTNAAEIMRQHLSDALDFLADFHTVSKIKSFCQGDNAGLNEDTIGGALKSGVAQYVALEMSRGARDNRAVARHLPWLYNAPSSLQQGPKEFLECMGHVRLLSWLLLGGLFQSLSIHAPCTPVPPEASCHVADHIQVILAGFAEQSKASVLHMSSLFHAFILCQLWTVYLEAGANSNPPGSEPHIAQNTILLDFWGKVTPCILQLVAHSKVLAEMVNLHFLSLLEALLEVNASILGKLMSLWTPVLFAHHVQLPGHLQVRLQNLRHFPPTIPTNNSLLAKWLQRLQFKMGQIELQSSAATQFYSV